MNRIMLEARIAGVNLLWVSASLMIALSILCGIAGDLVNLRFMSYDVIYPFFAAISVAEWAKTRTDPAFDIVAAQSGSIFRFIARRFAWVFCVNGLFAVIGIAACCWMRREVALWQLLWVYLATALFFSSLSSLVSLLSFVDHFAAALIGMIWLFFMAAKGLLAHAPSVRYFYPFLRLIAPGDPLWPLNKAILLAISMICWVVIYAICRIRRPLQD